MIILSDIQQAYYTAAQWATWNGVLLAGQKGIESDTLKEKVGNGVTVWNSLGYSSIPAQNLSNVLSVGNTTGANDIVSTNNSKYRNSDSSVNLNISNSGLIEFTNTDGTYTYAIDSDAASQYIQMRSYDNATALELAYFQAYFGSVNLGVYSGATGGRLTQLEFTNGEIKTNIVNNTTFQGIKYNADFSANYGLRSLVDKGYVTGNFQPLDSDLTSWAGVTRASGFDAFTATPSSANLASLVTDETGTGALVFGTSPIFTNDITTPKLYTDNTTFASQTGIIYKGGSKFIHDFNYGNNGTITTSGYNTFVGNNAGNLSMGATATAIYEASFNNCFGADSGLYLTKGFYNNFFGYQSGYYNTTGAYNTFMGHQSGYNNTVGYYNTFIGHSALYANTTGNGNSVLGSAALYNLSSGSSNTAMGINAGRYISGGSTSLTQSDNSIYIGANAYPLANGQSNQIVIGYGAVGNGSNTVTIGNSSMTNNYFYGIIRTLDGSNDIRIMSRSDGAAVGCIYINNTPGTGNFALAGIGNETYLNGGTKAEVRLNNASVISVTSASITISDAYNFVFKATTGTKIGTATTQKLSFWNATPIVQPTTAVAAATFTANTSGIANDTATFDGYTIGQVVKALRNIGLLA